MPGKHRRNSSEASYFSSDDEDFIDQAKSGESSCYSNGDSIDQPEPDQPSRRGRGPAKRPCANKNAVMARQNRLKKKEHLERLEGELKKLRLRNEKQYDFIIKQNVHLKQLTAENIYLRNVLKNKTAITSLLSSMNTILGQEKSSKVVNQRKNDTIKMAASRSNLGAPCRSVPTHTVTSKQGTNGTTVDSLSDPDQLDIETSALRKDLNEMGNMFHNFGDAGVCFHINSNKVSMEFCSVCHLNSVNNTNEPI